MGAIIRIKAENHKDSFKMFQDKVATYMMSDMVLIVKKVQDLCLPVEELSEPRAGQDNQEYDITMNTSLPSWRRYEIEYKEQDEDSSARTRPSSTCSYWGNAPPKMQYLIACGYFNR